MAVGSCNNNKDNDDDDNDNNNNNINDNYNDDDDDNYVPSSYIRSRKKNIYNSLAFWDNFRVQFLYRLILG